MVAFIRRLIRAVRILARERRIPEPIRCLAALGLLLIPGPFDEGVRLIVALILFLFYPTRLPEGWAQAAET